MLLLIFGSDVKNYQQWPRGGWPRLAEPGVRPNPY